MICEVNFIVDLIFYLGSVFVEYVFDYEIYRLTAKFEIDYPAAQYPELLYKADRPHYCMLIDIYCDYFICLPFHSYIYHANAFMFKNTKRSQQKHSGIDYSKMIIVKNLDYLDSSNVVIDKDEYLQAIKFTPKIVKESVQYLNDYISHINGSKLLNEREFDKRYKFSTLKYFHDILGLPNSSSSETNNSILVTI